MTVRSGTPSVERLKIIIDSNIFIAAEDVGHTEGPHSSKVAQFLSLSSEMGIRIVVANATREDILRAPAQLRQRRLRELEKYHVLGEVPLPVGLAARAGFPKDRSPNDNSDLGILSALELGAAAWLVTEDATLRRRAVRAGFSEQVFSISDVLESLRSYLSKPSSIPTVQTVAGYQVNVNSSIFDVLRADYPSFDSWWKSKVAEEHRPVLLLGQRDDPEGLAVLKVEFDQPHGIVGKVLKICTFVVAGKFSGARRGELLLKATIDFARRNMCDHVYVEAFPTKTFLIDWLYEFGFAALRDATTIRGESVLSKQLAPSEATPLLSALQHNVTYGPGSLRLQNIHIVPIRSIWHQRLLPEAEIQAALFPRSEACANAIRKAYLCNARTRRIRPGDTLLFLETGGRSAATALAVTESTLVSRAPQEIITFVGNRTVYSSDEINGLCTQGEVLAIRFRFDRVLAPPWRTADLISSGALRAAPRSIQRMQDGGLEWIRCRLEE